MRHLVIGAGPAGLAAVETLRALDPQAEIALVCDEPAYARMVLPYYLQGSIEERAVLTADAGWFEDRGVNVHLERRVERLEPAEHRVLLDDGTALEYDRCLVATGSRVRTPDVEGADSAVPMWTLEHARTWLGSPRAETVVVGAGFIAFTILDAVAERSGSVRFLEREAQILPRMLDAASAGLVQRHLEARGIQVRTGVELERIEEAGARRWLQLAGGESLECDSVLLATGIQPNVEFLQGSGVDLNHAIVVDDRMQTSARDVYAAGDVAEGPDLQGGARTVRAIQPVAVDHGRVAAANMAGEDVRYDGALTMNILAVQGLEATSFGRWESEDDVTRVENPADGIYRKYVWEGDRLAGGILVGPTHAVSGLNDVGMLKGLVQSGAALGPWRAHLEENPLDLRRPYVASGAAKTLLGTTLLAGRASTGGGFRWPAVAPKRARTPHHGVLTGGSSR